MIFKSTKTNGFTIALDSKGQLHQQNGAKRHFVALPKCDPPIDDFQICHAGIIAFTKKGVFVLAKNPKNQLFIDVWKPLELPVINESTGNGTVCVCAADDGKLYLLGYDYRNPFLVGEGPEIAKPGNLHVNSYGIFARSGKKTKFSPSAGRLGEYGDFQDVAPT